MVNFDEQTNSLFFNVCKLCYSKSINIIFYPLIQNSRQNIQEYDGTKIIDFFNGFIRKSERHDFVKMDWDLIAHMFGLITPTVDSKAVGYENLR